MFSGWQAFHPVTASAAGALIGLLFIVATLSAGRRIQGAANTPDIGGQFFTGPSVFHLALLVTVAPTTDGQNVLMLGPQAWRRPVVTTSRA